MSLTHLSPSLFLHVFLHGGFSHRMIAGKIRAVNQQKEIFFASISKFQIESVREHVTDSKEQKARDTSTITSLYIRHY